MTIFVRSVVSSSAPGRVPPPSGRRKWERELDYRLAKALWAFTENRVCVHFRYERRDNAGNWSRSYGNETGAVAWASVREGLLERGKHSPS
jgi:nuclear transport factor 2 (NTF2) superfamily protein